MNKAPICDQCNQPYYTRRRSTDLHCCIRCVKSSIAWVTIDVNGCRDDLRESKQELRELKRQLRRNRSAKLIRGYRR